MSARTEKQTAEPRLLWEQVLNAVRQGVPYSIDLVRHGLRVGKTVLVRDGRIRVRDMAWGIPVSDNIYEELEKMYGTYLHSVPCERSSNHTRYFHAPSIDEMPEEDVIGGERREYAQCMLELRVLIAELRDEFPASREYFWQSRRYRSFAILHFMWGKKRQTGKIETAKQLQ